MSVSLRQQREIPFASVRTVKTRSGLVVKCELPNQLDGDSMLHTANVVDAILPSGGGRRILPALANSNGSMVRLGLNGHS
jgi:hypothetical protein